MGNVASRHHQFLEERRHRRGSRKMAEAGQSMAPSGPWASHFGAMPGEEEPSMDYARNHMRACRELLLELFPDICPTYLDRVMQQHGYDHEQIARQIMDEAEAGRQYPTRPRLTLKRKRRDDDDGEEEDNDAKNAEAERRFGSNDRKRSPKRQAYINTCKKLLRHAFPTVHQKDLSTALGAHGLCLWPTYLAIQATFDQGDYKKLPFRLKQPDLSDVRAEYTLDRIQHTIAISDNDDEREALEEYRAVHRLRSAQLAKQAADRQREREEAEDIARAQADGTIHDCECCYSEQAPQRMINCNGPVTHLFCLNCARQMVETEIGQSRYRLDCMSMDGCEGGFSREQQDRFIDAKMRIALDRIEQEAVLRIASLANLETCPFCPFAAECPPIDIDKEFRCQNKECLEVSCRLCRKATHIPKSCQEAEEESGHSARRKIEEAMSAAMIRNCNKCGTPFIKENGCNKMRCTRSGCSNVQCYVCHKSCDYAHFNDLARGGKEGNCPLFDDVENRHADEVRSAEALARKSVVEQNPEVDAKLLEIKTSARVQKDEEKRKKVSAAHAVQNFRHRPVPIYVPPPLPPQLQPQPLPAIVLAGGPRPGAPVAPPPPPPPPQLPRGREHVVPPVVPVVFHPIQRPHIAPPNMRDINERLGRIGNIIAERRLRRGFGPTPQLPAVLPPAPAPAPYHEYVAPAADLGPYIPYHNHHHLVPLTVPPPPPPPHAAPPAMLPAAAGFPPPVPQAAAFAPQLPHLLPPALGMRPPHWGQLPAIPVPPAGLTRHAEYLAEQDRAHRHGGRPVVLDGPPAGVRNGTVDNPYVIL